MKTLFYYIPPTVALLFYALLVLTSGLGSIHLMPWFFVILLFIAAFMLNNNKWWGSLFGVIVGVALVWMSFQYTGQPTAEKVIGYPMVVQYNIEQH